MSIRNQRPLKSRFPPMKLSVPPLAELDQSQALKVNVAPSAWGPYIPVWIQRLFGRAG